MGVPGESEPSSDTGGVLTVGETVTPARTSHLQAKVVRDHANLIRSVLEGSKSNEWINIC